MATLLHIAKTLLVVLLGFSFTAASASTKKETPKNKKDSASPLLINARIVVKNKEIKGNYKVEVLYFNAITCSYLVKNNKPVALSLKKDSPYVIRISKKGFVPRYICLNTNMRDNTMKNTYAFYFETEFIKSTTAMRLDNETLELPIALISYDKTSGNFNHNEDYTSFVTQRISAGLTEDHFNKQD